MHSSCPADEKRFDASAEKDRHEVVAQLMFGWITIFIVSCFYVDYDQFFVTACWSIVYFPKS
jgi:hypothetical protein